MRASFILAAMMSASIAVTACGQSPGQDPFVFVSETDESGSRPAPGTFVWYLLPMSIRPTGTSVSGIRLSQINAWRTRQAQDRPATDVEPWCFANALSERSFTSSSEVVQANIDSAFRDNPEHRFRLRGRFTGENELLAIVGHYEECDGEVGSFIMLLDDSATPPRLAHVDQLPYVSGLQYMRLVDGNIIVSTCFECGDATGFIYDQRRRRFDWESLGD